MNVSEIVVEYLNKNGFDGLVSGDGECSCLLEDLAPCDSMQECCEPGYKIPCACGERCGWHIVAKKPNKKG